MFINGRLCLVINIVEKPAYLLEGKWREMDKNSNFFSYLEGEPLKYDGYQKPDKIYYDGFLYDFKKTKIEVSTRNNPKHGFISGDGLILPLGLKFDSSKYTSVNLKKYPLILKTDLGI